MSRYDQKIETIKDHKDNNLRFYRNMLFGYRLRILVFRVDVFLGVNLLSREGNSQEGYRMFPPRR